MKEIKDKLIEDYFIGKNITIKNDVISAEFNTAIIDYNLTYNKPSINGVELINAKTLEDFDIQRTIKAGENVYLTQSEANKMATTIEQNFKSFSLYDVGNTIACDLTEEDLLFLEAMGI